MSDVDTTQAAAPAQAPAAEHDATYKPIPHHKGLALVKTLLAHGGAPDPARIAELIAENRSDADEIAHFIQKTFGNKFMHAVSEAQGAADNAERHNLRLDDDGHHRPFVAEKDGYTSDRAKNRAKERHKKARPELNRISDHNKLPTLPKPTKVYDNMGTAHGEAAPGDVEINAGAVANLEIEGVKQECIFVYKAKPTNGSTLLFGWVPTAAFEHNAVLAHVIHKDKRIADKMDAAQEHGAQFSEVKETVSPVPVPADMNELRIIPNARETEPDGKKSTDNFARHYYLRPDEGGGSVNLLANVPGTGHDRFGIASDRLGPGAAFFRATNIAPAYSPLYITKSYVQSAKAMKFIFGYTVNNTGERQYGWLLADHLP